MTNFLMPPIGAPAAIVPTDSERKALGLLFRSGNLSQADLTRTMELTQPTVSRIISSLIAKGMVAQGETRILGRGQPSTDVHLIANFAYTIGLALLGDRLSFDVMDFSGAIRWRGSTPLPGMKRDDVLAKIEKFRCEMLEETGIDPRKIVAAGVGISAFFVGEGALMNPPPLLDDWALIDIAPIISQALGVPTFVDNDANVACIGEGMCGVGRRFRQFAYVMITNGTGGGVVIDGKPYRGANGNAGEFALVWNSIGLEHPNLERMRTLVNQHGGDFSGVSSLLAGLQLDHPGVTAWLDEAGPAFSLIAATAMAVLDCEAIVLGGRIPRALAERLIERIEIKFRMRRDRPPPMALILPAEAPSDPVSLGAAALAFQKAYFV